ncbi:YceI family protein [Sphaerisporangium album]|uniref:YceI family protein n=1 Tax=Sphaerisporangium album TaxID=509200 RepID=A0A367FD65_9ACTN|nr:YceI family protein [Sphaerisporangium album]RCG28308.1 YceI family protein [Sphaerisporangium album]
MNERYVISPARSKIGFEASSSVHPIHGEADGVSGFVDAAVVGGRVDLSAEPRMRVELPAERLRSGNPLYDGELRRRIDVRAYPRVTGEATEVEELTGTGRYRVQGDLTFHGVTRPVEGEITVSAPDDRTLLIEGEQIFDVRDFGLQPPKMLMLRVHPQVRVRVRIVAEREP